MLDTAVEFRWKPTERVLREEESFEQSRVPSQGVAPAEGKHAARSPESACRGAGRTPINVRENSSGGVLAAKQLVGGLRWVHRKLVGSDTFTRPDMLSSDLGKRH